MRHEPMSDAELAELERVYEEGKQGDGVTFLLGPTFPRIPGMVSAESVAALHNAFPRLLATIRQERERCAKVALAERVSGETGTAEDEAYNQACEDIAARIRSGE